MNVFFTPTAKDRTLPDNEAASLVKAWPYMCCYILFPLMYFDHLGKLPLSPNFGPIFVFGCIPLIDHIWGLDFFNPPARVYSALEKRITFRIVTWLWLPVQCACLLWVLWVALPTVEPYSRGWWGLVFNAGVNAGLGINMGHELIHKNTWFEHWSGALCLALDCYGHFTVEHIDGHHRRVATLEDPATSRRGEMMYTFWPRSIIGGIISSFKINPTKCIVLWIFTIAFSLFAVPRKAIGFFYLQGFIGILYLESVNYIEHYGLLRNKKANGEYEAVTPMHSWNAGHRVTNYLLLKLQRHSDHHAFAGRRYQSLRTWPWSPQLPFGYATMILLALVPPAFFRFMDWRVDHAKDVEADLRRKGLLDKVFTDDYLADHPDDVNLAHWE